MKLGFLILVLAGLVGLIALPYIIKTYDLKEITAADLPAQGAWAELSQGNLYYRWYSPEAESQNGETVVLVHGFTTPHFVWDGVKTFLLEAGYQVLVYDHFGRGLSARPTVKYDKALYVESLKELLLHQQVSQPVHLVGYSMGGAVAGHFSQSYPSSVKTLTLIAPAGFMTAEKEQQQASNRFAIMPLVGEWLGHMFVKKMLVSDVTEAKMANLNDPLAISKTDFVQQVGRQLAYKGYVESLMSTLRHFNMFNAQEAFAAVGERGIPTLAIWGTDDSTVLYQGTEQLLQAIPQAQLLTIKKGGHNITYMQPSIVGPSITDFLSQSAAP